ncbi:hypothetical protein [Azospirillum sp. TSH64]|uniref:hypothetical protein n=1 Tax=Azospirillum sp. TSH64 TaxID=652740 RepID=UPI0011B22753|nr:hypothetical protein [Azospirillum sp. TSH64]
MRFIFAEMRRQGVTYVEMSEKSGLARETLTAWRTRNKPDLESLEAALGVLGFDLGPLLRGAPVDLGGEITASAAALAGYRLSPRLPDPGALPAPFTSLTKDESEE